MNRIIISTLFLLGVVGIVCGQPDNNGADKTLRASGRVNSSTLGMEIDIPLGSYPGRGMNIPISLSYSSKVWRMEYTGNTPGGIITGGCRSLNQARFSENSAAGWTTSLAIPYIEYTGKDNLYTHEGFPLEGADPTLCDPNAPPVYYQNAWIRRLSVHLPGGETHELRADDAPVIYSPSSMCPPQNGYSCDPNSYWLQENWNRTFYAVDGSNLKYIEDSNTNTYRLLMPDGSYYDFGSSITYFNSSTNRKATKYTDRNGNFTSYNDQTGTWTDTLGRTLAPPIGVSAPTEPTTSGNPVSYILPGMSGSYKFHWKRLKGDSPAESALTDFNQDLKYPGDKMHHIANGNWQSRPPGTYLFSSEWSAYVLSGTSLFNPVVLTEIELPTGHRYTFAYDIFGRIEKISYPTGGEERFQYAEVATLSASGENDVSHKTNHGVVNRKVYEMLGDPTPYEWTYSAGYVLPHGYVATVNNPDGTKTQRFLHRGLDPCTGCTEGNFGFDNGLAGMPYEEQSFDNTGVLVSRELRHWTKKSFSRADWHPRVTQEESIVYDSAGNGVSATTTYEYEGDLNLRETPVLVNKTSQFAFEPRTGGGSFAMLSPPCDPNDPDCEPDPDPTPTPLPIPSPSPIRIVESTYLISDPNYASVQSYYRNQNMVGLVTVSKVKDGAGVIQSQSETIYDDTANHPILTPTMTPGGQWGPPIDGFRGNPNIVRVWDSTKGLVTNPAASISTQAQFDNYGNQVKAWDARGNLTTTTFDTTYYAFPIQVTSPVPDPTGQYGSNSAFVKTATFNMTTGLPLTTTDANGQTTTLEYNDPLLRPTRVISPNGSETIIQYDNQNARWVKTKTQINATTWKEAIAHADGLGRPIKSESVEIAGSTFSETEYDVFGRVKKASNPYRNSDTKIWTETIYDEAGRPKELITPDGAKIVKSYGVITSGDVVGLYTTITDQAGKSKRIVKNSLGQVIRVDEPDSSGNLGALDSPNQPTAYEYNVLDKLTRVVQGSQTRMYVYDSLARLKQATNPESGIINYQFNDSGNLVQATDARGVATTYAYDNIGRMISRTYSDGTPGVSYTFDNPLINYSKGRLTKVSSLVSETEYTGFDNVGRITSHKQTTDGQSYTTSYMYDISGALIEQIYPSGRVVKNVLDNNGDLSMVKSKKNQESGFWNYAHHFNYTASGAIVSMQLGNGAWESTQFNSRLQPTQIGLGTAPNSTNLLDLDYSYGTWESGTLNIQKNNGNIAQQTLTVPTADGNPGFTATQTYTYDSLNRLRDAKEVVGSSETWKQTFTYDRYGNKRFDTANTTTLPPGCPEAVCNPQIESTTNRLVGSQFDSSGNMIRDAENRKFTYNGESRQVKVEATDQNGIPISTIGEYFYDGNGKRVKKHVPATGETTVFVYDASGKLIAEYSTIVAPPSEAKVSYLTTDHLGSPRIITDSNGKVISRRDFHPFGEEVVTAERVQGLGYKADGVRKKFTGYERDKEIDLDFAQSRYFSYEQGRFTSPDDFLNDTSTADPASWNLYVYGRNNPLKYVDPAGERIQVYFTDENGNRVTLIYKDGKLYHQDGKTLYTGNNEYALRALNYLNTLRQHPILRMMIDDLVKTSKVYTIQKNPTSDKRRDNAFVPTSNGGNVYWSGEDSSTPGVVDNTGQTVGERRTIKSIFVLAHELLGHGWYNFKGIEKKGSVNFYYCQQKRCTEEGYRRAGSGKPPDEYGMSFFPGWELDATSVQNIAMVFLGEDPQLSIGGNDVSDLVYNGGLPGPTQKPVLKGAKPSLELPREKPVLRNRQLFRRP